MFVNVKGLPYFLLFWALLATDIVCPRADAQQFGLSVTPSARSILVGSPLTYTINLTNLSGGAVDTVVTNFLPSPAQFQSATNFYNGNGTYLTNSVYFGFTAFPSGNFAKMTVTVVPTASGSITDTVIVASVDYGYTNTVSTNVVVQVTNAVTLADLGVTMIGPKQVVITNDWITYGVAVTNAGPNAASGVMLTNILPAGVVGISSPKQNSGTNTPISLGTLASGGSTNLFFQVEPANAGVLPFSAFVGSSVPDTNTANNFGSTNITVTNYLSGALVAVTNSAQSTNFTLGLLEQSIIVSNIGTSSVPAIRLVLTGLTNRLYNAVGTNNGNPFVYYSAALPANENGNLLLQYSPRKSFPFTNSQLHAFAVPMPDWTPPPATTGTNLISRILQLTNGNVFIEWPATAGKTYTVVYSDNVSFSNAMIAPPSIVAPANDVGWIDYGPPTTINVPASATARFYRVYQNP